MTLQEIAQNHWSGYVASTADDHLESSNKTTYSFCDGKLESIRINNKIVGSLSTVMDSGKDDRYYICTKYRKKFIGTDEEYRIALKS